MAHGQGMYLAIGFEDVCDIGQYVWAPERWLKPNAA